MMKSAAAILAIPLDQPERLFTDRSAIKDAARVLLKHWHPDVNHDPLAAQVMAQINVLRTAAERKHWDNTWDRAGFFEFTSLKGLKYEFVALSRSRFDLGETIYNRANVCFVVEQDWADLAENARRMVSSLKFANDEMREEMKIRLPFVTYDTETDKGRTVIVMKKADHQFSLADVIRQSGGKLDPTHVAWIMNAIYTIACYLECASIAHNSFSSDSIFISPKNHYVTLLGGWWYARQHGARLNAMSQHAHKLAPPSMLKDKISNSILDRLMIKALGREMLGDPSGMRLAAPVSQSMIDFLRDAPASSAVEDYARWQKRVLPASFGVPRFIKWDFDQSAIYGVK